MIHVVSAAIVADKRLLLSQRSPLTSYGYAWCTPGGKVNASEAHGEALARELREELGVEFFGNVGSIVYEYDMQSTRTGDMVRVHCYAIDWSDTLHAFGAKCLDGTVGVGWFSQCDLLAIGLAPADDANRKALADLLT